MSLPSTLLDQFEKSMKDVGFADRLKRFKHHFMNLSTIMNGKKMRMIIVMELVH